MDGDLTIVLADLRWFHSLMRALNAGFWSSGSDDQAVHAEGLWAIRILVTVAVAVQRLTPLPLAHAGWWRGRIADRMERRKIVLAEAIRTQRLSVALCAQTVFAE